ncbi:MAG: ShlB/FhaC/HecB family hemolysin secretion/activation protein, partial [Burkholderiaceae bacterium]
VMPKFDILEYKIDGNSRLSEQDIERAVTPFLGEEKNLRDVEGARAALEKAYHDAGYLTVLVTIPEQKVTVGVVDLHVIEAPVDRLRVKGSEYHTLTGIKARVPELAEGNVPNFPQMQRELASINRNADLKATPILRAGKAPGTVEAQLDVEDQLPLHGNVEVNNRQSPNTTATRLSGSVRYDNLWQLENSIGLTMQVSPEKMDQVRVFSGTYVMPLNHDGDAFTFYSVNSRSKMATLENAPGLGILGNTDIYGVRYAMPLTPAGEYSHNFSAGIDYKNVKQSVAVNGVNSDSPAISYAPLVATYTGNWLNKNRPTTLDLTTTLGLRRFLGNSDNEFAAKRSGASANYLALRTGLLHMENIGSWTFSSKLEMQLASGPLVPNEQFTAGGAESVRGYLEGERAGDEALRTSFELRSPQYRPWGATSLWGMTGLAFFDGVRLRIYEPVYPQTNYQILRGYGLGIRLAVPHGVAVELDWARALNDADVTKAGSERVHARLVWEY